MNELTPWSALYDLVMPEVNGAAPEMVDDAIRAATIQFCEKTLWLVMADDGDAIAGETQHYANVPHGLRVCAVLAVWFDGKPLPALSEAQVITRQPLLPAGHPVGYLAEQTGSVTLHPPLLHDRMRALRLLVAVAPTNTAIGAPAWLIERYGAVIADGAKHHLMRKPGRPYSNPQLAQFYGIEFANATTRAAVDVNKGGAKGTLRVDLSRSRRTW